MAKQPKKPKKPKQTAPLSSWLKYDEKVKAWHKKISDKKSEKAKKAALIKKHQ